MLNEANIPAGSGGQEDALHPEGARKAKTMAEPTTLSPKQIVAELDRYIVGQKDAKRAVAVALRNRWRRQQLSDDLKHEVTPKNILMIGPTGVGKTEISRRLAISRKHRSSRSRRRNSPKSAMSAATSSR